MFRILHKPELRKEMPSTTEGRIQKMKDHLTLLLRAKATSTLEYAKAMDFVYLNADYYTERILTLGTYRTAESTFIDALKIYLNHYTILNFDRDVPLIKLASKVLPHVEPKQVYFGPACQKMIADYDNPFKFNQSPRKKKKTLRDRTKKPRVIYDMRINRWI